MQQQSSKGLPRDLCGPVALLLMLALSPATALASQITGEISLDSNPGTFFKTVLDPFLVAFSGASSGNLNGFQTDSHASVFAEPGIIKISGDTLGALTGAGGRFEDGFSITAPGIPQGTPGSLTFSISVFGELDPGPGPQTNTFQTGQAGWGMDASASPHGNGPDLISVDGYNNYTTYSGTPFNVFSATVPFQYGDNFGLSISVGLTGYADGGDGHDPNNPSLITYVTPASFDLSHSLYWAGISNVTANGNPVTDFTALSPDGVNYANSFAPQDSGVPEPASFWLVAAGIPGAWFMRRRFRQGRSDRELR
jgi:hypothetical protein